MLRTVLLSILVCSFALQTQAAEIEMLTDNEEGCTARLTGEIKEGDAAKLSNLMNGGQTLCLESPGGDFLEGLEIANLLNAMGISTHLEDNAECLSACALAFLGGSSDNYGVWRISRSINITSKLGFHAPFLEKYSGYFNSDQLESAFRTAIEATALLVASSEKYGLSTEITLKFLKVPKDSYYFVESLFDAYDMSISLKGTAKIPRMKIINFETTMLLCKKFYTGFKKVQELGSWPAYDVEQFLLEISPNKKAILFLINDLDRYDLSIKGCMVEIGPYGDLGILRIETGSVRNAIEEKCADLITPTNNVLSLNFDLYQKINTPCSWYESVLPELSKSYLERNASRSPIAFGERILDHFYLYGDAKFSDLLEITKSAEGISLTELRSIFMNYDADVRAYLQRTLRNLGLYSSSIDGNWSKGTEGAFQKLFDTMDEYYPDLKWRQDFGFDDGEIDANEFGDFWNAAVGCDGDKLLRNTHLCQQQDSKIARAAQACGWFSIGFCSRSASEAESKAREHDLMLLETTKAVHPNFNAGWYCVVEPQTSRSAAFSGVESLKRKGLESAYAKNSC